MNLDFFRAAALIAAVGLAACSDAPTEPAALLVAEHARAALRVDVPLPSLADAESMDAAEFEGVLTDLGVWLGAAEARLAEEAATPEVAALKKEVAGGRESLVEAARLEADGERGAAVAALLGAQAQLLRTTAFAVAERALATASAADAHCARMEDADAEVDRVAVRRGRRLLAHAREALMEQDFERGLQRAHYAEMLLTGACTRTSP